MVKIKKYANGIERFMSSPKGQRFFNFAYSIGAAVVIWGALFKILHLPGGSTLLCIGMGTEIAMFIITAFDRPPKEYKWEDVFPVLDSHSDEDRPEFRGGAGVVINGGAAAAGAAQGVQAQAPVVPASDLSGASAQYLDQMNQMAAELQHLRETTAQLNQVSDELLQSYAAITQNSNEISASSTGYVEQMQALNHNIGGLNTIYEIQLKSVSSQLDAIDRVNRGIKEIRDMFERSAAQSAQYCEETEKMARYMQQLNAVYERMITAMTVNMYRPPMPGAPVPSDTAETSEQ